MKLDDYVTLGRSGLRISRLSLGTATFGNEWGLGSDEKSSADILDRYIDLGGNFIDSSNSYNEGHSEAIVGDHLGRDRAKRDRVVITTKYGGNHFIDDANGGGGSRKAIVAACEQSLRRLRTDYIDLYWQHWWDKYAPVDETMRALDDLVRAGKIRYAGFSDTPAWKVVQAQVLAEWRGWAPLIALQIEYSLLERTVEGELIPMAREMGLGVMPWSPLRSGVLSGKITRESPFAGSAGRQNLVNNKLDDTAFEVIDVLRDVSARAGVTPAQAALAWLLGRADVASPIIGARTMEQLEDNLSALDVRLSEEAIAALDAVSAPVLSFPVPFLDANRRGAYGPYAIDGERFSESAMSSTRGAKVW